MQRDRRRKLHLEHVPGNADRHHCAARNHGLKPKIRTDIAEVMFQRRRFLKSIALGTAVASLAGPAKAQTPGNLVRVSRPVGTMDVDLSPAWDDREILLDNTIGNTRLLLGDTFPDNLPVPDGFSFVLRKYAPQSNSIHCKPIGACTLGHFWKPSDPYGRFIILAMAGAKLTFDAVAKNWIFDPLDHLGYGPRSQRTVIVPAYQVTPESICEIVECNADLAGAPIFVSLSPFSHFCPASPVTGGCYLSWPLSFIKVDRGPRAITVAPAPGERFNISNDLRTTGLDRGYIYLKECGDGFTCYISAGGIYVTGVTGPGLLP